MPGITLGRQVAAIFAACGLGFLLGIYYEIFKTVRLFSSRSVGICVLEDIVFCVSSSLVTFFAFLALTDGVITPYLLLGEALGFFVFYGSLGRVLHKILAWFFNLLIKLVRIVKGRFFLPVHNFLSNTFHKTIGLLRERCKKLQKRQKKSIFFSKKP